MIISGNILALFKKGDRRDKNNYRGICLLPFTSRVLAKIMAKILRDWTEKVGVLDENQAGFRQDRSTADATWIFIRLQEDELKLHTYVSDRMSETETKIVLLDLRKAYPKVNKPILWRLLKHYNMPDSFIDKLKDLHEFTVYKVKGSTSLSSPFYPQRGFHEGCASSPILFNIYHQAPIRTYQQKREEAAKLRRREAGVKKSWRSGHEFPPTTKRKQVL